MAEKKKRRGRREHLNDFYLDVGGNYQYAGPIRRYEGDMPWRDAALRVGVLAGAMALSLIAVGLIPAPSMVGMGNFYVVLPYVLELVGVFLSVWAAVRLIAGGEELRNYVYEATVDKFRGRLTMTMIFAISSVIGNAAFLIMKGFCALRTAAILKAGSRNRSMRSPDLRQEGSSLPTGSKKPGSL